MRLFLAVLPDEAARDALCTVQQRMYEKGLRGSYDDRNNFHLTLAYIGEYPDPQEILRLLAPVRCGRFSLTLSAPGCFRKLYWCGVKDSRELDTLAAQVRQCLKDAGIPFDQKAFVPHITLLRKAYSDNDVLQHVMVPDAAWEVNRISLMRSERGEHGMIYTEIAQLSLQ